MFVKSLALVLLSGSGLALLFGAAPDSPDALGRDQRPSDAAFVPAFAAKVAPGLVTWHADFDAARAAAETSDRPILHFQLLGELDEALC